MKILKLFEGREILVAMIGISVALIFISLDIYIESHDHFDWKLLVMELIIAGSSFLSFLILALRLYHERAENRAFKEKFESMSKGNIQIIDRQLHSWDLSDSEKDIAILLVKGMSFKEIAVLREVKERTVRTQATAIYKKSNLANRNELAAFFLDDLTNH